MPCSRRQNSGVIAAGFEGNAACCVSVPSLPGMRCRPAWNKSGACYSKPVKPAWQFLAIGRKLYCIKSTPFFRWLSGHEDRRDDGVALRLIRAAVVKFGVNRGRFLIAAAAVSVVADRFGWRFAALVRRSIGTIGKG